MDDTPPPPPPSPFDTARDDPLDVQWYRRIGWAHISRGRVPVPPHQIQVRQRAPDVRRVGPRQANVANGDMRPALRVGEQKIQVIDFTKGDTRTGERDVSEVLKLRGAHHHLTVGARAKDAQPLSREELQMCTEQGDDARARLATVTFSIIRPQQKADAKNERLPALIFVHDEGKSKEEMIPRMEQAARRGYVAVAMDLRHHGSRAATPTSYARALEASLRTLPARGAPTAPASATYLLDSVYDLVYILDYLTLRGDVDTRRIGVLGVGHGGTVAWLLAAADARVTATATILGAVDYQWLIDADRFGDYIGHARSTGYLELDLPRSSAQAFALGEAVKAYVKSPKGKEAMAAHGAAAGGGLPSSLVERLVDRLAQGLRTHFAAPRAMCAISPRPLFIAAGELDGKLPVECVEELEKALDVINGPKRTHVVRVYADIMDNVPKLVDDDADAFLDGHLLQQV